LLPPTFIDVRYDDLVRDPAGQVRRVPTAMDIDPVGPDAEAITARAASTRSGRRHQYDPSWFGIEPAKSASGSAVIRIGSNWRSSGGLGGLGGPVVLGRLVGRREGQGRERGEGEEHAPDTPSGILCLT
jgi:hypothetical protein